MVCLRYVIQLLFGLGCGFLSSLRRALLELKVLVCV